MSLVFTNDNFNKEVLESETLVLVDFWAPWCGPCQMMGPMIDELSEEYKDKDTKIGKCNVDENQDIASQYNVMSIPTFLVFKGGQVIDQVTGGVQKEKLKEMIDKNL